MTQERAKQDLEVTYGTTYKIHIYNIYREIPRQTRLRGTHSSSPSYDIHGIVNHGTNRSTTYLPDERVGPKNTDHTVSYLAHYISQLPEWTRRVHIFIDNTWATNKN